MCLTERSLRKILSYGREEKCLGLSDRIELHPEWNPLMLKGQGKAIEGERLKIYIHLF